MNEFILTSESVTMNHLDKISNIISNSILDAYLTKDSTTRLEAETAVKNNAVILVGKASSKSQIDMKAIIRNIIRKIGYSHKEFGFSVDTAEIISRIDNQSSDIVQDVDSALNNSNFK